MKLMVLAVALLFVSPGFTWPTFDDVPVIAAGCPSGEGTSCTWRGGPIYLSPIWGTPRTLAHERGHHFDYRYMDDGERNRFRTLTGDPRPWRSPPNSPHERFAEAYSFCVTDGTVSGADQLLGGLLNGGFDYRPTLRVHRRICRMLSRAGRDLNGESD